MSEATFQVTGQLINLSMGRPEVLAHIRIAAEHPVIVHAAPVHRVDLEAMHGRFVRIKGEISPWAGKHGKGAGVHLRMTQAELAEPWDKTPPQQQHEDTPADAADWF